MQNYRFEFIMFSDEKMEKKSESSRVQPKPLSNSFWKKCDKIERSLKTKREHTLFMGNSQLKVAFILKVIPSIQAKLFS